MFLTVKEIIEACLTVKEEENRIINSLTESIRGGIVGGLCAFTGALLMGRKGGAIGL